MAHQEIKDFFFLFSLIFNLIKKELYANKSLFKEPVILNIPQSTFNTLKKDDPTQ